LILKIFAVLTVVALSMTWLLVLRMRMIVTAMIESADAETNFRKKIPKGLDLSGFPLY
jgi:hypothetical protein